MRFYCNALISPYRCSNGNPIKQVLLGNVCDVVFDATNWEIEQTITITARIDYKIDEDFVAKLKVKSTLIVNNTPTQTVPVCQEYNVSTLSLYTLIELL